MHREEDGEKAREKRGVVGTKGPSGNEDLKKKCDPQREKGRIDRAKGEKKKGKRSRE